MQKWVRGSRGGGGEEGKGYGGGRGGWWGSLKCRVHQI